MSSTRSDLRIYSWQGIDNRGASVSGKSEATSLLLMKAELRRLGIKPTHVKKIKQPLFSQYSKKIPTKEIAIFSRQLATMMSAGVPLVQAFEITANGHENPAMQKMLLDIKNDIEGGNSLVNALRNHPSHFDALFCNLIAAGEKSGTLETLLDKIALYKEKTEAIKARVKKALFYPTAVVIIAILVCVILLIYVVPQFQEIFSSFGADLPMFTHLVIDLSEFIQAYWWIVFSVVIISSFTLREMKKRFFNIHKQCDRLALKLPIIGTILKKSAIARFSRTLSTMFAAGVPLVEAMNSVAGATGNILFHEAILNIREEVATGTQLHQSMRSHELFPNMVVQMISIGEQSGSLDSMLAKIADFYEDDVDNLVNGLSSLLEPLIMSVLGVLVGGLVIAMYLPIFQMGSVV